MTIQVRAAGMNPADAKHVARGKDEDFPRPVGYEVAGVVTAVGPNTEIGSGSVAVGDEVLAFRISGGWATEVTVRRLCRGLGHLGHPTIAAPAGARRRCPRRGGDPPRTNLAGGHYAPLAIPCDRTAAMRTFLLRDSLAPSPGRTRSASTHRWNLTRKREPTSVCRRSVSCSARWSSGACAWPRSRAASMSPAHAVAPRSASRSGPRPVAAIRRHRGRPSSPHKGPAPSSHMIRSLVLSTVESSASPSSSTSLSWWEANQ